MKFLTFSYVNFKTKMASYFTGKKCLFRNNRDLQFGTRKLWQNHGQVELVKDMSLIVWRRRRPLGGVVLNESPLEKSRSLRG